MYIYIYIYIYTHIHQSGIILIISSSWYLLVVGIYQAASEHFVLKVDVLEAGKMGKCKDLREFDTKL